ncbi:MAG: hypothetical protein M0Q91_14740 [Methanoregula sp.]|jgi:hypothetical protein|nr:hypothetical protein [Methanoregula sp.]
MTILSHIWNYFISLFCSLHGYKCDECVRYTRCPVVKEIEQDAKKKKERINQ